MIRIVRAGEPVPATLTAKGPKKMKAHAATLQQVGGPLERYVVADAPYAAMARDLLERLIAQD